MTTPEPPGSDPQDPQGPPPPPEPGAYPPSEPSAYPPPSSPSYPPSYPPSSPPPPPGGGSGSWPPPPPPAGPGPDQPFGAGDAITYGFTKFRANLGQWLLGGLLFVVVSFALSGASFGLQGGGIDASDSPIGLGFNGVELVLNLVSTIVTYLLTAVLYRGALDEVDGRRFSLGDTFSRIPVVPVILTSLLVGIGTSIGLVLCVLPGLVFAFLTFFALMFVVDRGDSPIDAIKASVSLISANLGNALLLALVCLMLLVVGLCLLCVGLIVAYPVTTIAAAYAYRRFQGQPVAP